MKIRHALFAIVAASALLALLLLPRSETVHADEHSIRPTATPDRPPRDTEVHPQAGNSADAAVPDLVVDSIEVFPNPVVISQTVTIDVTISNIGDAPVEDGNNYFVDLFLDPDKEPRPCDTGDYHWDVQGHEIGTGSLTLSVTLDPTSDPGAEVFTDVGTIMVYAYVDSGPGAETNQCGHVQEGNEYNNVGSRAVDVTTNSNFAQLSHEDFRAGFSSALDLTHPQGVLENGTGWFVEPRFPPGEVRDTEIDAQWANGNWDAPNFYNPDRHVEVYNYPEDFPRDQLETWNPPAQGNVSIEVGFEPRVLYAVWDDEQKGSNNRDILFSYSIDHGKTWIAPVQVNKAVEGTDQMRPELALDREAERLYIFWQDNRLDGSYDIFFARSLDRGATWEEPMRGGLPVNPLNDKKVNPNSDQINVSAVAINSPSSCDSAGNCEPGPTQLYVAWEDYRNGQADIFFEWSRDGGDTWLRTPRPKVEYEIGNIHVQPDPAGQAYDPGKSDQRRPSIFLNKNTMTTPINWCYDYYWEESAPPRVYIVWEDDRHKLEGGTRNIFYTRGDYDYRTDPGCGGNAYLPPYRFEDDHVRVNREGLDVDQGHPDGSIVQDSFFSDFQFTHTYSDTTGTEVTLQCEVRYEIDEVVFTWQDSRDGTYDIWAANSWDDFNPTPHFALAAQPETEGTPPSNAEAIQECEKGAPWPITTPEITREGVGDNESGFEEIAHVEGELKISEGNTFEAKKYCTAPHQSPNDTYEAEPSNQTRPSTVGLPNKTPITKPKFQSDEFNSENSRLFPTHMWSAWEDNRAYDVGNQDIFLRPTTRIDDERELTIEPLKGFDELLEANRKTRIRTVQNNAKNQILLREWDLHTEYKRVGTVQANPSLSYADGAFYVGWEDNRNANPLLGFDNNWDIFAAQLQPQFDPYDWGRGRPMRTATYLSPIYDAGKPVTWYHIQWWGDISADGEITLQTRFGMDPDSPEPPREDVAENGWTQWTGVGGTGGAYNAPGQHMVAPDGGWYPRARYVQYRVNFNPGQGQRGIHCLSEVRLNYHKPKSSDTNPIITPGAGRTINLPMILDRSRMDSSIDGAPSGRVEPNDPYYVYQWNLNRIRAPDAWSITTGGEAVVAVLDTGVDYTHPDLANRMAPREHWYNFVANNNDPMDDQGHGSHVAGIVAASSNNQAGIAGVSWGARLLPLKVLDANGQGTMSALAAAVKHAADRGVRIINLSLGGPQQSEAVAAEIRNAYARGSLVIAAAGNCHQGGPECGGQVDPIMYPAAQPETFAVAATSYADGHASYSNTGSYIDIAAPGGDEPNPEEMILSTVPPALVNGEQYVFLAGTSMAAPHVAGLAALMLTEDPTLSNTEMQALIEQTALDLGAVGWDEIYGHGRIDARTAMEHTWQRKNGAGVKTQSVSMNRPVRRAESVSPSIGCMAEHVPDQILLRKTEAAEVTSQSVLGPVATELVYDLSEWQVLKVPEGEACALVERLNRESGQRVAELDLVYSLPTPRVHQ